MITNFDIYLKLVSFLMTEDASWNDFPRIPEFLKNKLVANGYDAPFPVQTAVIDRFFSTDADLAIGFPTGSGKTLSYLIPLITVLSKKVLQILRAVIVVPNRELAIQVFNTAASLIDEEKITIQVLNTSYYTGKWVDDRKYPDLMIASASSLSNYIIEHDEKLLAHIEYIVLDEGDAILNQPLENWLDIIHRSLKHDLSREKFTIPMILKPSETRQIRKILCSATLARNSKHSEDFGMKFPEVLISSDKSRYVIPTGLKEEFVVVEASHKAAYLQALFNRFDCILCFVSTTKRSVSLSRIMSSLIPDLSVVAFSSNASEIQRKKALEHGESDKKLVIATDRLARGIDLPFIDCVVNFDMPLATRTYIHRIGRTARGNKGGCSITFLLQSEIKPFIEIVSKIDGSNLQQIEINTKGLLGKLYQNVTKGFDKFKIRKLTPKYQYKPNETDSDEEEEELEIGFDDQVEENPEHNDENEEEEESDI